MHSPAILSVNASWLINKNNQLSLKIWIREAVVKETVRRFG